MNLHLWSNLETQNKNYVLLFLGFYDILIFKLLYESVKHKNFS